MHVPYIQQHGSMHVLIIIIIILFHFAATRSVQSKVPHDNA